MNVSFSTVYTAMIGCLLTIGSIAVSPSKTEDHACIPARPTGSIGQWEFVAEETLEPSEQRLLAVHDYWRNVYSHRETGLIATVTWMSGERGPMVSHQPTVCYQRESMYPEDRAVTWAATANDDRFRIQTFRSRGLSNESITIAHGWKNTTVWAAPDHPRLTFFNAASLQKLQVSIRHPSALDVTVRPQIKQLMMQLASLTVAPEPIRDTPMMDTPMMDTPMMDTLMTDTLTTDAGG